MGRKLALVAGVSSYEGRWPALKNCVNDAEEVAEALAFKEYGFHVDLLLNEQVTKSAILRWLLEVKSSGAESILFYFAGHGVVDEIGSFLVTHDNQEFDEGINLATLLSVAEPPDESSTQVIIILDCCHSGFAASTGPNALSSRQISNSDVQAVVRQSDPSAVVIAACAPEQKAIESSNLGHGVFTHHLLNALLGYAADHVGDVTVHSLYDVVSRDMASTDGLRQEPVFGGRVRGRVILGTGFTPVLSPPKPEEEYELIEGEARDHLNRYNRLRSADTDVWRTEAYATACRTLESISAWFASKEKIQGMSQRDAFRNCKATLLRYQSELGVVEPGTHTRWGQLDGQIGAGGFGKVWRLKTADNRKLAYKLYHANELSDREKVKRFRNGYDAMRMLNHPRIVNVYDYSDCPPGFVMDYVDGENLRDLAIGRFLEHRDIVVLLLKCAEAIHHAHLHDVIHRDIKPENIVCEYGEDGVYSPYLTDFDLAWFSTQTQKATKTAMGVVYYAAPEQYVAFNPKAARSRTPALDVYSFGQLMYFCFVNRDPEPINIESNVERLNRTLAQSCPVGAARAVIDLYRDCVHFSPGDRIQDFTDIIEGLGRVNQDLSHTDQDGTITTQRYLEEVFYQMMGHPPQGEITSFANAAGSWEIAPQWRDETSSKAGARKYLYLHFKPTQRVALENMSNEKMRTVRNRWIDTAIAPYRETYGALRHPGQRGEFEFFLEWHPKAMTRSDALKLCEALRNVTSSLASGSIRA
ncbi:caspase family protein [Spirillospora sp. NPDC052242]